MAERFVRYAALTGYPALAASLGLDAPRLLRSVGLDIDELVLQDKWIPGAAVARLLEKSAQQSGCEDFGVRMAGLRRLPALGRVALEQHDQPAEMIDALTQLRQQPSQLLILERAGRKAIHLFTKRAHRPVQLIHQCTYYIVRRFVGPRVRLV